MRSSSLFCARLLKNCQIIIKNSTLTLRGRVCLSKKCAVFAFGDAMQRSGQAAAFPTALFGLYGATSEGYRPCSQDTIPRNHLNKTIKNCPHELHKPMSARGSKLELILLNEIVLSPSLITLTYFDSFMIDHLRQTFFINMSILDIYHSIKCTKEFRRVFVHNYH